MRAEAERHKQPAPFWWSNTVPPRKPNVGLLPAPSQLACVERRFDNQTPSLKKTRAEPPRRRHRRGGGSARAA